MDRDEFLNNVLENTPIYYHEIYDIIHRKENVFEIFKTDAVWEAGDYRWVVAWPDVDDDYWINSFITFEEAVEFCDALSIKWRIRNEKS